MVCIVPVMSVNWTEGYKRNFLRKLKLNGVFGFSASFTKDQIIAMAEREGVKVDDVSPRNPIAKDQDLNYLLRVTRPATSRAAKKQDLILNRIRTMRDDLDNLERLVLGLNAKDLEGVRVP